VVDGGRIFAPTARHHAKRRRTTSPSLASVVRDELVLQREPFCWSILDVLCVVETTWEKPNENQEAQNQAFHLPFQSLD
jgi:hypothetical protein